MCEIQDAKPPRSSSVLCAGTNNIDTIPHLPLRHVDMTSLPRHQIFSSDDVIDDIKMSSLSHDDVIYDVIGIH